MQTTITINEDVLQKAQQALMFTHFNNVEAFIAFLVEEKLKEMPLHTNDPILRLRGKLKGKKGGTVLFMQDKKTEIEKEYAI